MKRVLLSLAVLPLLCIPVLYGAREAEILASKVVVQAPAPLGPNATEKERAAYKKQSKEYFDYVMGKSKGSAVGVAAAPAKAPAVSAGSSAAAVASSSVKIVSSSAPLLPSNATDKERADYLKKSKEYFDYVMGKSKKSAAAAGKQALTPSGSSIAGASVRSSAANLEAPEPLGPNPTQEEILASIRQSEAYQASKK